jgi:hypothetical protein
MAMKLGYIEMPFLCQVPNPCKPFRINTCKSLSKQTTSTLIVINTYEKQREGR